MIVTGLFSVSQQVLILFILIAIGFICTKAKLITSGAVPGINNLVLYVVAPCVIIDAFHREFSADMLSLLGLSALASVAAHAINIIAATLLIQEKDEGRKAVLRFGAVFSNCGYMALPLQSAILGSEGVFYAAAFVAVFNIMNWTYGIFIMGGKSAGFSAKKLIINPGIIGIIIGLFFFLSSFSLPEIILSPMKSMAALNTPLPMVVIGYYLACLTSLKILSYVKLWIVIFLRLIALPLAALLAFYIMGLRGTLLVSAVISSCAPVAANALVFASKFERDTELAATLVPISTLISVMTMPVVVALSMALSL